LQRALETQAEQEQIRERREHVPEHESDVGDPLPVIAVEDRGDAFHLLISRAKHKSSCWMQ
jgi:hypothetical protein